MSAVDSAPNLAVDQVTAPALSSSRSWNTRFATAALSVVADAIREHRIILVLALGYVAIGGLVLTALGRPWPIQIMASWFATVWGCSSALWLAWQWIKGPRCIRAALAPRRVAGALLVTVLVLPTQITFQALKQSIGPVIGFHADAFLHQVDVTLHGGMPWVAIEPLIANQDLMLFVDLLYKLWFIALITFVIWVSWTKFRVVRQRAIIAFLLLWIAGGTVAAWAASSVGPCYYHEVVQGPSPYAELMTQLDSYEVYTLGARASQGRLWEIRQADEWKQFGGISAMPSMHVGFSVLLALIAWQLSRYLGLVLWTYAIVIQVGSVALAWHYAIDGYAGALIAIVSWRVARVLANVTDAVPAAANHTK